MLFTVKLLWGADHFLVAFPCCALGISEPFSFARKQLVLRRLILQGPALACLSFAEAAAHFNEVVSSRLPNTRFLPLQF